MTKIQAPNYKVQTNTNDLEFSYRIRKRKSLLSESVGVDFDVTLPGQGLPLKSIRGCYKVLIR